jgi:ribosome-associated toxin RatA of RatAB toxin-antitoxin module
VTPLARIELGEMPLGRPMETIDELDVRASVSKMFQLARDVESWPKHLAHYRFVGFRERDGNGGGIVEMSANRPFGVINWPTWWLSEMEVNESKPAIRFRHIGGITNGMDVEWTVLPTTRGTHVRIVHVWDGPHWPLIGIPAATMIIGPVFVHGIASLTLAGLADVAELAASRA